MEYGYARVSSKDQNLGRQIAAFKAQGIKAQNVYCDKKSGKDFDRIYYKRLVRRMKEGDVLFITELGSAREKLHGDFRAVAIFDQTEKRLTLWCWIWICLTRAIQVIWFIPLW